MPPKVAWYANNGGAIPRNLRQGPHLNEVVVRNEPPTPGPMGPLPRVLVVTDSDIFTYNTEALVIATDTDMERRNEHPPLKQHTLSGPNLRRWNRVCNRHDITNASGVITSRSRMELVASAVRSPGKSALGEIYSSSLHA
jgi:hypothetical protein